MQGNGFFCSQSEEKEEGLGPKITEERVGEVRDWCFFVLGGGLEVGGLGWRVKVDFFFFCASGGTTMTDIRVSKPFFGTETCFGRTVWTIVVVGGLPGEKARGCEKTHLLCRKKTN